MKREYVIAVVIGAILLLGYFAFSSKPAPDTQQTATDAASKPANTSTTGLSGVAAAGEPTDAAKLEIDKLWPHLKKEQPTEAQREKVKAEWKSFAAKYPGNIYIPNEFKPALTEAEAKAAKQQLDDVTAVAAQNAAQSVALKNQAGSGKAPVELTEKQAREKGITPEAQNNFFNYKIKELESRIQLGEFSLTSSEMDATQKAAMQKEMLLWKKELDELTKVKAQIPKS